MTDININKYYRERYNKNFRNPPKRIEHPMGSPYGSLTPPQYQFPESFDVYPNKTPDAKLRVIRRAFPNSFGFKVQHGNSPSPETNAFNRRVRRGLKKMEQQFRERRNKEIALRREFYQTFKFATGDTTPSPLRRHMLNDLGYNDISNYGRSIPARTYLAPAPYISTPLKAVTPARRDYVTKTVNSFTPEEMLPGISKEELIANDVDGANGVGSGPLLTIGDTIIPGTRVFSRVTPSINKFGIGHDMLYTPEGRRRLANSTVPLYRYSTGERIPNSTVANVTQKEADDITTVDPKHMSPSEIITHALTHLSLDVGRALGITNSHFSDGTSAPINNGIGSSINLGQVNALANENMSTGRTLPPNIRAFNQIGGKRDKGDPGFSEDFASKLRRVRYGASQLLQTYGTDEDAIRIIDDNALNPGSESAQRMILGRLYKPMRGALKVLSQHPIQGNMEEGEFNDLISV